MASLPPFRSRRFPPRFEDADVERDYRDDGREGAIRGIRAGLAAATAAWIAFGAIPLLYAPARQTMPHDTTTVAWAIALTAVLAAVFVPRAPFSVATLGAALNAFTGFAVLGVGVYLLHHAALTLSGTVLVILFSGVFFRLPFIHVAAATLPYVLVFQLVLLLRPASLPVSGQDAILFSVVVWIGEGFALAAAVVSERFARQSFERKRLIEAQQAALEEERARSDRLLRNVLPSPIADRLRVRQDVIADAFAEVTILFCDLAQFTELSSRTGPAELVQLLNRVFTRFDVIAQRHGLEKIKTIGDAYMAAAGVPVPREDHADAAAEMALDLLRALDELNRELGLGLQARIGLNSGPVVAGVIGQQKFAYDLWGDAVNTAARMESHGVVGEIQVSHSTFERLQRRYRVEERGTIEVKGKGPMRVYFLKGSEEDRAPLTASSAKR